MQALKFGFGLGLVKQSVLPLDSAVGRRNLSHSTNQPRGQEYQEPTAIFCSTLWWMLGLLSILNTLPA